MWYWFIIGILALKTVRGKETIGNIWFDIDMRSLFYVERMYNWKII